MEITKELKEKLLNANSEEEVKALLGAQAPEEEAARVWHEIKKNRAPGETLEAVDDDELEAVSGGILGFDDNALDGHEKSCILQYHRANECEMSKEAGGYHYWKNESGLSKKCTYCNKRSGTNCHGSSGQ